MDAERLQRYSRHLLLPEIDIEGQERLSGATVLLLGAGGLGSPVAMYLVASGIGRLVLLDDDRVDLGNLQRQILHATADVGRLKTDSALDRLHALNPDVAISGISRRLDLDELATEAERADVIVDASDNFETRFALSAAAHRARRPLVFGAAIGLRGQVTLFDHRRPDSPCLACLYPPEAIEEAGGCAASGVLAPLTGVIGSMMAVVALKVLLGMGDTLCGRLLRFDATGPRWCESLLARDPGCDRCAAPGATR